MILCIFGVPIGSQSAIDCTNSCSLLCDLVSSPADRFRPRSNEAAMNGIQRSAQPSMLLIRRHRHGAQWLSTPVRSSVRRLMLNYFSCRCTYPGRPGPGDCHYGWRRHKGAITSRIKHAIKLAIKLKTSPARLAQLLYCCTTVAALISILF